MGGTIRIGTQCAFDDRTQLAEILALPEEKIRVAQLPVGGAFGAKEDLILQQHLALGALRSGRPVKMVLTRTELLRVHAKRHPAKMRFKVGAGHPQCHLRRAGYAHNIATGRQEENKGGPE